MNHKLFATTAANSGIDLQVRDSTPPVPGLVLIFANGRPGYRVFRAEEGSVELGRQHLGEDDGLDSAISRQHARLVFEGTSWQVCDLGSRNGTFVDGARVDGRASARPTCLVRIGGALLLACPDVVPFARYGVGVREGIVEGPGLRKVLETVALARKIGMATCLLISGESGTGKEIAAKAFHLHGPHPNGPWVPVNCAAIPGELAERLLFGSKRGAFSGSTDADGYAQAARGGTLFLDEIAELRGDVQSKLLRLLESREVLRLGATRYEPVELAVCAASWRDLRQDAGGGRFRADLYFRLAQAEVRLPPLRERVEEIPWHIEDVLESCRAERPMRATVGFVEACAARAWPGNVRELRAEVRRAAGHALACGSDALTAADLGPAAGRPLPNQSSPHDGMAAFSGDEIAIALAKVQGNVVSAARELGVHRNKVRRWLERHGVDPKGFKTKP